MITTIDAIYSGGVFKPIDEIDLPDNQRVRITVEHREKFNVTEWLQAVKEFHSQLEHKYGVLPDSTGDIREDRRRDG